MPYLVNADAPCAGSGYGVPGGGEKSRTSKETRGKGGLTQRGEHTIELFSHPIRLTRRIDQEKGGGGRKREAARGGKSEVKFKEQKESSQRREGRGGREDDRKKAENGVTRSQSEKNRGPSNLLSIRGRRKGPPRNVRKNTWGGLGDYEWRTQSPNLSSRS